jgi:hypothetical protein
VGGRGETMEITFRLELADVGIQDGEQMWASLNVASSTEGGPPMVTGGSLQLLLPNISGAALMRGRTVEARIVMPEQ